MEEVKVRLIHLHGCRGVGWKTIYKFLKFDPTLETIFTLHAQHFPPLFQMTEKNAELFYADLHSQPISETITSYNTTKISVLTLLDDDYPVYLRQIFDPPWVLYIKGNKSLLKTNCLSVVGTRNPSPYGYAVMKMILPQLVLHKWTIVSGLATGIDTGAHRIAMQENGHTIAVLGSGFNYIYPSQNQHLAEEISTSHLLLSEFPPNRKAEKWHFPLRNRIISGLSKGTLIIEAKERSGSLITAEQALEQGREVFAIPGSIFEPRNQGTNRLIQQGAKLIINCEDIIDEFKKI